MRPILIQLGPIPIHSYGFMLMIGFAAGVAVAVREAKRRGLSPDHIVDYALWALLSSILGSRIVYILLNLEWYRAHPDAILQWQMGGLSFHGGIGGAILALYLFCRKRKLVFVQMMDLFAPSVPLGYAFARIGCFLNGCCYGGPTDLPWGVCFASEEHPGTLTPPSHPVQLYASALNLVLFALLMLRKRHARFDGQIAYWYFAGYCVIRFGLEYFRSGYTAKLLLSTLTEAQIASLVIFTFAVVMLLIGKARLKGVPSEDPPDATPKT